MSSAVAVLRSACHALRRPPFPRALIERQPPSWAQNSSTRRFYSADCTAVGKPAETTRATVDDGLSRTRDEIKLRLDAYDPVSAWKEFAKQAKRELYKQALMRCIIRAGGVAAIYYVKQHGTEEDMEISAGNN